VPNTQGVTLVGVPATAGGRVQPHVDGGWA
jgi:hypothetical protein